VGWAPDQVRFRQMNAARLGAGVHRDARHDWLFCFERCNRFILVYLDLFESFPNVKVILNSLFWCPSLPTTGLRLVHMVVMLPCAFIDYVC
jgi:hypothetical protein